MIVCFVLALIFGFVAARPQQASSVSLFEFFPTSSGINPTLIDGIEWAQPIGTASDSSATTFILENVLTASPGGLTTLLETVAVSASGWDQSNSATGSLLGGGIHCFFTASSSGECDEEEVFDGTTSTRTFSGDVFTQILQVTALLPIFTETVTHSTTVIESGAPTVATTSKKSQNNILGPLLGGLLGGLVALTGVILAAVNFFRSRSRRRDISDSSGRPSAVESAIRPFTASGTGNTNRSVMKATHPIGVIASPSPIPEKTSHSHENAGVVAVGHQLENWYNQMEEYSHQANSTVLETSPPSYDQLSFVDQERT